MTAIENKLSKLPACNKKYKDIGAEVNFELQYMRREGDAPNPKQSFIGMQM